jgi:hypothetical protein
MAKARKRTVTKLIGLIAVVGTTVKTIVELPKNISELAGGLPQVLRVLTSIMFELGVIVRNAIPAVIVIWLIVALTKKLFTSPTGPPDSSNEQSGKDTPEDIAIFTLSLIVGVLVTYVLHPPALLMVARVFVSRAKVPPTDIGFVYLIGAGILAYAIYYSVTLALGAFGEKDEE